ncbi:ABCB family ABC transporter ATP-binding protein/permease [Bordetella genomosp. 5]|uniref:Metal ABC transporter permease n=1 Tax=Bordetella genomosp. 5 TaxID=1395608 RepID=A0A261TEU0_9BORD|nr:ABC transporter ATP-binding protein/permease [Bordetella genomosp. 5]OZI47935.1 metal ABC transporter permease [Bordetella genomosp. 5]
MSSSETPPPRSNLATFRTLMPYLWPKGETGLKLRVVLAVLSLLIAKAALVYTPILYKSAIDALSAGAPGAVTVPLGLILAYGAARVLSLLFSELRDAVFARVAQHAIRAVGLQIFRHLHALALRFHLARQTGGLTRAIERGTKGIQTLLTFLLFNVLPTFFEIGLVCIILWKLFDGWLALATGSTVTLYLAYTLVVTEWRAKFRRAMNETDAQANTKAIESLLNYETVKYFGNEEHEARRYDASLRDYERAAVRSQVSLSILNIGQAVIIAVGLTLVMWMAAQGIADGRYTLGDFVLVNTYLLQLYDPLSFFGFIYREIKQALIDMERMFELLGQDREVADAAGAAALVTRGGRIEFRDVSFGYDARRPILQGVSFTIEAGKTAAVVGTSGAGKSTLARLMFRFYDPDGGAILVDGQDIRQVTQSSLRAAIGVVPQDTVLFNDTIRYNIAYGRPGASQAEVEHAARLAHIHDHIMGMPEGYDTVVGERGLKLSGGEKQRVAIARTMLKNPCIFLFDEATSALDTHTEREIQANLREVSTGRSTLIIAHRLSTIAYADEILVLGGGKILERGRHHELLAAGGVYAGMWSRQQESARQAEAGGAGTASAADADAQDGADTSDGTVAPDGAVAAQPGEVPPTDDTPR